MKFSKTLPIMLTVSLASSIALADNATNTGDTGAMQDQIQSDAAQQEEQILSNPSLAMFKKLDTNHDGIIDKNEASADQNLAKVFKKVSKNGKINEEDYTKWEQKQHNKKPG